MSKIIYGTIATDVGLRKLNAASLAGSKVEITKVKYGDSNGAEYQPVGDELDLKRVVYESGVNAVDVDNLNPSWVNIESIIPSNVGGFWIREMGLYDSSGDLIFITAVSPREKPIDQAQSVDMSFDTVIETINPDTVKVFFNPNKAIASQSYVEKIVSDLLKLRVGEVNYFHSENQKPGYLDLNGGEASREVDSILWGYAQSSGLVIEQALKDSDLMKYAMYFGSGDGDATFSLPNHHLGHFVRGTPSGISHGKTQGDAIRNITGSFKFGHGSDSGYTSAGASPNGVFGGENAQGTRVINPDAIIAGDTSIRYDTINFDASKQVPTSNENRPYTANLSAKIHRGWA